MILNYMDISKMKVVIARPQDWIDRSKARTARIWFYDVEALYDAIPEICKKLKVKCEVRMITPHTIQQEKNTIYLAHHTYGKRKNVWHIKKGYVPGYMYWDKLGYSGWSEGAKRYDPSKKYLAADIMKTLEITLTLTSVFPARLAFIICINPSATISLFILSPMKIS